MKKQKTQRTNRGITLIALVITIIVMLILVAVTITMAVNGGLFEYASNAGTKTNEAIKAEQQLADGRLKIGNEWYASIDDYINNNPIEAGIIITPSEVELKKKETQDTLGEEVKTQTISASVFGMEEEPEITWEPSSNAISLSATKGKSITITAEGTEDTIATLTAKCIYNGEEIEATINVKLEIIKKPVEFAKGDFVQYNVAYTDAFYDEYEYTTTNGWRLLNYTDNGNGTISNVKLMSTGIPAKLKLGDNNSQGWWVTTETSEDPNVPNLTGFKNVLGGEDKYHFWNGELSQYKSLQISAGLYYNFGNIKFKYSENSRGDNMGHFSSITVYDYGSGEGTIYNNDNNSTVEKSGNELFKIGDKVKSVRILILREINEDIGEGEFYDMNLPDKTGMCEIEGYEESYSFLFASPGTAGYLSPKQEMFAWYSMFGPEPTSFNDMYTFDEDSYGVRPVICFDENAVFSVGESNDGINSCLTLTPIN